MYTTLLYLLLTYDGRLRVRQISNFFAATCYGTHHGDSHSLNEKANPERTQKESVDWSIVTAHFLILGCLIEFANMTVKGAVVALRGKLFRAFVSD